MTIERVECITSVGSASITVDEVTFVNSYGSGTPVADFVPFNCTTAGNAITSFTNASIAAGALLTLNPGTTSNDADLGLFIRVYGTKDD